MGRHEKLFLVCVWDWGRQGGGRNICCQYVKQAGLIRVPSHPLPLPQEEMQAAASPNLALLGEFATQENLSRL